MGRSVWGWVALFAAAAALVTGCESSQGQSVGVSAAPLARTIASRSESIRLGLPEPKSRNLLYVSNDLDYPVAVYTFPGVKFVGSLTGPSGARGLCTNKVGDIFVPFVYIPGGVYEYAHGGGTPIAQLGLLYDYPNGCSINPKTGALAVVAGPNHRTSAVAVYRYNSKRGWGLVKGYTISSMASTAFGGYDDRGDLFVDGETASGDFALAELPKSGKAFVPISVTGSPSAPGQVQWDGNYLAVGDTGVSPSIIYQFDVSGSTASRVGATMLKKSSKVEQFWIQGGRVVAPDDKTACGTQYERGCLFVYNYPSGGAPTETIELPYAFGATVSL